MLKGPSPPGSPLRTLAAVLNAQVQERLRAVRDEQQKADVLIQKLEALRALERNLLRDRVRSGGGDGGSAVVPAAGPAVDASGDRHEALR